MVNIFKIDKNSYELNEIEQKFLINVLNFIKDRIQNCNFLNKLDLNKIKFKYAPEFLINNDGIFGAWSIINNTVYLRPNFIDERFLSYIKENYDSESKEYKKFYYSGILRNTHYDNINVDIETINRFSHLAGNVVVDSETYDSLFITTIHELYHKYQFQRNPLSYFFKSFLQLIVGYDKTLKNEFYLEGEVRQKIESNETGIFKYFNNFTTFFNRILLAFFYIDKIITFKNKLNDELTSIERAETEKSLNYNKEQFKYIKNELDQMDKGVYEFCIDFCIKEKIISENVIENIE